MFAASCTIPDQSPSPDAETHAAREELVGPEVSAHAMVRVPDGEHSVLLEQCGGAIRQLTVAEVGEAGWWLVFLPPSYLDDLSVREGIEWRPIRVGVLSESGSTDSTLVEGGDVQPTAIDGDPCTATPAANEFCPYDLTTSTTEPSIICNASVFQELGSAPATYGSAVAQVVDLGLTYEGRTIRGVRLGKQWSSGAPVRQVVVYAAQHAREWITTEMSMRLLRDYASRLQSGDPTVAALLANTALLIVPVANPDGYAWSHSTERTWRPNREPCSATHVGTDPNRNFPFSWGQPGASGNCGNETYRGPSAASAAETTALIAALVGDPNHYRTVAALNLHSFGNHLLAAEGFSSGFSPCTTLRNCTAPDLGVFHLLAGTERSPRMRDEETSSPYVTQQTFRALYEVAGDSGNESHYGSLAGAPRFVTVSAELTHTECGQEVENVDGAQIDSLYSSSFRPWIDHVVGQAAALETGSGLPSFDLPILHRRQVAGTGGEFPTFRIAIRTPLTGESISAGVPGTAATDDMIDGVYYSEWRWRPSGDPYTFPNKLSVCATGANCRTARLDAPSTFSLCDSSRWSIGSGWAFIGDSSGGPQDECFWRFTGTGSAPWRLTSTTRDLSQFTQSRLVYSFRWKHSTTSETLRSARVVVSSNGFSGCSETNYGNCRIVRLFPFGISNVDGRSTSYRTDIVDIADFDGKAAVQIRFEVLSSAPVSLNEVTIHDPVVVGWSL